jgi:5-methylcytosine-specific restriction endonuclease McrA
MTAAERRYRDWLSREHPDCVCGARAEHHHHIIHLNNQRITKDEMLVIPLCQQCHQGKGGVHDLGGERQFLEQTGWNLVELAVLRRHDWELRA